MKNGEDGEAKGTATPTTQRKGPRLSEKLERIGAQIADAAYTVHQALEPGLLESVYEACLAHERAKRGLAVRTQVPMLVAYGGVQFEMGFRLDILVEEHIVVEVKAIDAVLGVHITQLRTYLKLAGPQLGFLVNFDVALLGTGIWRLTAGAAVRR